MLKKKERWREEWNNGRMKCYIVWEIMNEKTKDEGSKERKMMKEENHEENMQIKNEMMLGEVKQINEWKYRMKRAME